MQQPCNVGIRISERALLSMLEGEKFNKNSVLSTSEQNSYEVNALVSEIGLSKASSRLGLKKSSLKRALTPPAQPAESYDESSPAGLSRRYLEKNFGKWKVRGLDRNSRTACLETVRGVKISIDLNFPAKFISET